MLIAWAVVHAYFNYSRMMFSLLQEPGYVAETPHVFTI